MMDLLIEQERYLEAGIHIGTKIKTPDMNPFIYKARQDKLYVLDLKKVDDRIRVAAKLLSRFPPEKVIVSASRTYAANAVMKFCELTGFKPIAGRVIPGIFTNPARPDFMEPSLVLVSEPKGEKQAIKEASVSGVPVIGLCDTDNSTKFVDWVIPCNNKGKKSLALIYFLLTREVLKARGAITSDDQFSAKPEEFEEAVVPAEAPAETEESEKAEVAEEKEGEQKTSAV